MNTNLHTVLEQFVRDNRYRTLLIKGAWGVGKTHAVREFLLSDNPPAKTVSYVSLSGVTTVSDERLLAISGVELEDGRAAWEQYPRKFGDLGKALSK
jgi:hypothetical protein